MDELLSAFDAINLSSYDHNNEREILDKFDFSQAYSAEGDALKASLFKNEADHTFFYNLQLLWRSDPGSLEEKSLYLFIRKGKLGHNQEIELLAQQDMGVGMRALNTKVESRKKEGFCAIWWTLFFY